MLLQHDNLPQLKEQIFGSDPRATYEQRILPAAPNDLDEAAQIIDPAKTVVANAA